MEDAGSRLSKKIYKKRTNDTKKKTPQKWNTVNNFLYISVYYINMNISIIRQFQALVAFKKNGLHLMVLHST